MIMVTNPQLERAGLLDNHKKLFFSKLLSLKESPEKLLSFLTHFASFQESSSPAAAYLLSKITFQRLFVDPNEELEVLNDRNHFIASFVADSVLEEFNSSVFPDIRSSHVCLSQAFLKGIITGLHIKDKAKEICREPEFVEKAKQMMFVGHGYGRAGGFQQIFNCMGFFLGSKHTAPIEFKVLDDFLSEHYKDLVDYLKHFQFKAASESFPAYSWVLLHRESKHRQIALDGANQALALVPPFETEKCHDQIILGFKKFIKVRQLFLERA